MLESQSRSFFNLQIDSLFQYDSIIQYHYITAGSHAAHHEVFFLLLYDTDNVNQSAYQLGTVTLGFCFNLSKN